MKQIQIRPARELDVLAIEIIVQHAYKPYIERIGLKPAPMMDHYAALVAAGMVWVVSVDGTVAGLIVLEDKPDHILLCNVAVAPHYQGQGLGKNLLDHAESYAREKDVQELRLYTNEKMHENLALYARLGWVEYDRAAQDGFRRVFMRKTIKT